MTTAAIQRFVDDELMRAPMIIDMTMQAVFESLQKGPAMAGAAERKVVGEMIMRLGAHRATVSAAYLKSLREQVVAEMSGKLSPVAEAPAPKPLSLKPLDGLALVDEEDVAVDVVTSHTIETIKSVAESELRELMSFTSALANDMDVTRDHNPLRVEVQARALWVAAQALPMGRAHQLAFVRMAALPFAQALRKGWSAACGRLEEQGVEPAAYRTLILPRGPRRAGSGGPDPGVMSYAQRNLNERIDAVPPSQVPQTIMPTVMPAPASSIATPVTPLAQAPGGSHAPVPQTTVRKATLSEADAKLAGLVDQLFDTMLADRRLPAELQAPFLRLQSCATKAVLLDENVLDRHSHALWRFIDLVAHEAVVHPGPDGLSRELLLRFVNKLVDQLVQETRHVEQLYGWAIERLDRYVAKRLAERLTQCEARIAEMQALEDRMTRGDASPSTMQGAIDVEQLETVPADLMDAHLLSDPPDRAMTSSRWLLERRSGDWLRLFRKGQWGYAQLLWPGDRGEVFLFADGDSDDCWAIRRSALLAMRDSKLATMAWPRSLVADATTILLKRSARLTVPEAR